jgi:hypothetical protein
MCIKIIHISVQGKSIGNIQNYEVLEGLDYIEIIWQKQEKMAIIIVTVCVFVHHLFSFYPFYFDFHSAHIIFDVSSGFYLWNINKTTAWHL